MRAFRVLKWLNVPGRFSRRDAPRLLPRYRSLVPLPLCPVPRLQREKEQLHPPYHHQTTFASSIGSPPRFRLLPPPHCSIPSLDSPPALRVGACQPCTIPPTPTRSPVPPAFPTPLQLHLLLLLLRHPRPRSPPLRSLPPHSLPPPSQYHPLNHPAAAQTALSSSRPRSTRMESGWSRRRLSTARWTI